MTFFIPSFGRLRRNRSLGSGDLGRISLGLGSFGWTGVLPVDPLGFCRSGGLSASSRLWRRKKRLLRSCFCPSLGGRRSRTTLDAVCSSGGVRCGQWWRRGRPLGSFGFGEAWPPAMPIVGGAGEKGSPLNGDAIEKVDDILPGGPAGDGLPPPAHVPPRGEELRDLRMGRVREPGSQEVVRVGEVEEVGHCKLVPRQELALPQPLLVHVQHLRELPHAVPHGGGVRRRRREAQVERQLPARGIESVLLELEPLLDGCPLQRIPPQQAAPPRAVLLGKVPAYGPRLCNPPHLSSTSLAENIKKKMEPTEERRVDHVTEEPGVPVLDGGTVDSAGGLRRETGQSPAGGGGGGGGGCAELTLDRSFSRSPETLCWPS